MGISTIRRLDLLDANCMLGRIIAPKPGFPLSAGDLLASWLAHDFLHLRQLTGLHWEYVSLLAKPYSTDYAGMW